MTDDTTAGPPGRPLASPELEATIQRFFAAEAEVATLEEQLSLAKARRKYIGEHEMIEAADPKVRASGVQLSDGSEWTFEQAYHCSISDYNKTAGWEWLEANGASNIIKRRLTLELGKDSTDRIRMVRAMLAKLLPTYEIGLKVGRAPETLVDGLKALLEAADLAPMITVEEDTSVHTGQLKAFVKKMLAKGKPIPEAITLYAPLRPSMTASAKFRPCPACGGHGTTSDSLDITDEGTKCADCDGTGQLRNTPPAPKMEPPNPPTPQAPDVA